MGVALDLSKAFDSDRRNLIFAALEKFNFGESFIGYVRILFTDIESCLINYGTTSDTFCPALALDRAVVSPRLSLYLLWRSWHLRSDRMD